MSYLADFIKRNNFNSEVFSDDLMQDEEIREKVVSAINEYGDMSMEDFVKYISADNIKKYISKEYHPTFFVLEEGAPILSIDIKEEDSSRHEILKKHCPNNMLVDIKENGLMRVNFNNSNGSATIEAANTFASAFINIYFLPKEGTSEFSFYDFNPFKLEGSADRIKKRTIHPGRREENSQENQK